MMLLPKLKNCCLEIACVLLLLGLSSCGGDDPYLYDRTGFDQDSRPVVSPNPSAPKTAVPDYYRQQQYAPYQQQYAYPPAYQQPVYAYPQYQGGGSRYYSNPYAIPAAPAVPYYQRYDVDQYYVPPTYYGNYGSEQKMKSTGYE